MLLISMAVIQYDYACRFPKRGGVHRELLCLVACEHPTHKGPRERLVRKDGIKGGFGITRCHACMSKGRIVSEETRRKLSTNSAGENNPNYGKKHSPEELEKMSKNRSGIKWTPEQRQKRSESMRGDKHFGWKPELTEQERKANRNNRDVRFREWSLAVKKRDNFTCQVSGDNNGQLVSHHLYNYASYPELRFDINNGVTISKPFHDIFHMIYGIRNNTPEQFYEFREYIQDAAGDASGGLKTEEQILAMYPEDENVIIHIHFFKRPC